MKSNDMIRAEYSDDLLRRFLTTVFRRKKLVVGIFLVTVLIVTIYTFVTAPIYEASSKILVERDSYSERAMLFRMSPPSTEGYDWIKSELEILQSHPVLMKVVRDLELEHDPGKLSAANEAKILEKALIRFRKKFAVRHARNTNVIEVSYQSTSPELAARTVNRVIEEYLRHRSEVFDESASYQFLEEQMQIADKQLKTLENDLAQFKDNKEMLSPSFQGEILLTKLADFERSLTGVRTRIISKEAKLSIIIGQLNAKEDPIIPSTESSNSLSNEKYIAKLKGELLDMEIERDKLLQRFTPNYDGVIELENQIAATKGIIRSEIQKIIELEKTAIRALKAEERALIKAIDEVNQEVKQFAQKEFEFNQINRGLDDNQEIYSMLLKQREETRLSLAKMEHGVKVKLINAAVVPQKPIKPRKRLNLMLAVVLGVILGVGVAYFIESISPSISSAYEMARLTGMPVLGTIAEIEAPEAKRKTYEDQDG